MKRFALFIALATLALSATAESPAEPPGQAPAADSQAGAQAEAPGDTPAGAEAESLVHLAPDLSRALLTRFLKENPNASSYVVGRTTDGYDPTSNSAALRLERLWIGQTGTLMELTGLPRHAAANSAVIRRDTLHLRPATGRRSALLAFDGAEEVQDRRGGSALIIKPGDSVFLLLEAIDSYRPFSLEHVAADGSTFTYFSALDPRFRERYDDAFRAATTPVKMKDFLVEFARNDPDGRVRGVFIKLIEEMRAQNSFEGYYTTYLLLQDPADLRKASSLARTDEHRAKIEHMAVSTLADKSRLVEFTLKPQQTRTSEGEGSCWMFCNYNFSATRGIAGSLTARMNPKSPIQLRHGQYRVTFNAEVFVPRTMQMRSGLLGEYDKESNQVWHKKITVVLSPPNYSAQVSYDLGHATLAFFQRGAAGGFEAHWSIGDPRVTFTYEGMELLN